MNDNCPYLSVIFPVVGAADNLLLLLIDADRHLRECGRDYEIIVAGYGSSEDVPEAVRKLHPIIGLRLVGSLPDKRWIDAAKRGLNEARGRYRLLCASSGEAEMTELLKLPKFLEKNSGEADIVLGKRNLRPDLKRVLSDGVQRLLIPELSDPESPFICLGVGSVDRLTRCEIGDSGIHFVFVARSNGMRLAEVPVALKNQPPKIGVKETAKIVRRAVQIKTESLFEHILGNIRSLLEKASNKKDQRKQ